MRCVWSEPCSEEQEIFGDGSRSSRTQTLIEKLSDFEKRRGRISYYTRVLVELTADWMTQPGRNSNLS